MIDWPTLALLGAAIFFERVESVPLRYRHTFWAAALLVCAGWRARQGLAPLNLAVVVGLTLFALKSASDAWRASRARG